MHLYVSSLPLHPIPGICIGISESPAALGNDTQCAPIDERCGITSQARNQPLASFWILFRPGLGYYCPDGEARKAAVFLGLDFSKSSNPSPSSGESAAKLTADYLIVLGETPPRKRDYLV